jgi:hypothetical protein
MLFDSLILDSPLTCRLLEQLLIKSVTIFWWCYDILPGLLEQFVIKSITIFWWCYDILIGKMKPSVSSDKDYLLVCWLTDPCTALQWCLV